MSIENIVEEIRAEIRRLEQAIVVLNGTRRNTRTVSAPLRGMSLAGRRKIAAAQRARWAKVRAAKK
jgi:hypothetical protein